MQTALQPANEAPAGRRHDEADILRRRPRTRRARCLGVAMNGATFDVDEPDSALARRPDRTFAELRAGRADALNASLRPRSIHVRYTSARRRKPGTGPLQPRRGAPPASSGTAARVCAPLPPAWTTASFAVACALHQAQRS